MASLVRMSMGCKELKKQWSECDSWADGTRKSRDCEEKFRKYYLQCLLMMGKPKMRIIEFKQKPK